MKYSDSRIFYSLELFSVFMMIFELGMTPTLVEIVVPRIPALWKAMTSIKRSILTISQN